jgi:hypothetical protein
MTRQEKLSLQAAMQAAWDGDGSEELPDAHNIRWDDLETWSPRLNPTQREVYESPAKYILAHGERGSGKTIGVLHKLVRHCIENVNALAIIIVGVRRQGEEGGAWHKLQYDVLPTWRYGNRSPDEDAVDDGIGVVYTDSKTNVNKDTFLWIANRHDGWSKVLLLSMPVEQFIKDRFRGPEASFIMVDEAQGLNGPAYFKDIVQQCGRRPGIPGSKQQICYCANPDGPRHWLYKRFFEYPIDAETGEWNPDYAKFHVPISENLDNLPEGYYDNVIEAVRGDDIEFRRLVRGEWIDRPESDALFPEFSTERHVRGDAAKNEGIIPLADYPVEIGYDLGAAHSCVTFIQLLPVTRRNDRGESIEEKAVVVFDEINTVGEYVPYRDFVPMIVARMDYWDAHPLVARKLVYRHISDDSAFNQYRAAHGSFDCKDVEDFSEGRIKLVACPKGSGSVTARVRATKDALSGDLMRISATCRKIIDMFILLREDSKDKAHPKRSLQLHPFDSLSYVLHYYGVRRARRENLVGQVKPEFYRIGGGIPSHRQRYYSEKTLAEINAHNSVLAEIGATEYRVRT